MRATSSDYIALDDDLQACDDATPVPASEEPAAGTSHNSSDDEDESEEVISPNKNEVYAALQSFRCLDLANDQDPQFNSHLCKLETMVDAAIEKGKKQKKR